jgi:hypothetical protein
MQAAAHRTPLPVARARRAPAPDPASLPRPAATARFVAADRLDGRPHICVDGRTGPGALLELSHWPGCATPHALAASTATEIALRYLDAGPSGPEVDAVGNNHMDVDGLLSAWVVLTGPAAGDPVRDLAVETAAVGDFGVWRRPEALCAALALTYLVEGATTPLRGVRAALGTGGDPTGPLHDALLPRVRRILDDPGRAEPWWRAGWDAVGADTALLDAGDAAIEEIPELDLAVVRAPRLLARPAWAPRTARMRVLSATPDGVYVLEQRYETFVAFSDAPLAPRADLAPAAARLAALETGPARWRFEGLAQSTPRLLAGGPTGRPAPSALPLGRVLEAVHDDLLVVGGGASGTLAPASADRRGAAPTAPSAARAGSADRPPPPGRTA